MFVEALGGKNVPSLTDSAGAVTTTREGAPGAVIKLGPSGEVLKTYEFESGVVPTNIAVSPAGTLFLSSLEGLEDLFRAYEPDGTLLAEFSSDQLAPYSISTELNPSIATALAFDESTNVLYAGVFARNSQTGENDPHVAVIPGPHKGPPEVSGEHATDVEPTTATLNATVNPEGYPTEYRFEYGTEAGVYTHSTTTHSLPLTIREDPVSAANLLALPRNHLPLPRRRRKRMRTRRQPRPHMRRPRRGRRTPDPAARLVRGLTTQTVAPEHAILKVELDNNNSLRRPLHDLHRPRSRQLHRVRSRRQPPRRQQQFEATRSDLHRPRPQHHLPLPSQRRKRLRPAEVEKTDDASPPNSPPPKNAPPKTAPPTAPHGACCAKKNNSLALPDCRAYEQVSPPDKGGLPGRLLDWFLPRHRRRPRRLHAPPAPSPAPAGPPRHDYLAQRTAAGWPARPASRPAGPDRSPPAPTISPPNSTAGSTRLSARPPAGTADDATAGSPLLRHRRTASLRPGHPDLPPRRRPKPIPITLSSAVRAHSADFSRLSLLQGASSPAARPTPVIDESQTASTRSPAPAGPRRPSASSPRCPPSSRTAAPSNAAHRHGLQPRPPPTAPPSSTTPRSTNTHGAECEPAPRTTTPATRSPSSSATPAGGPAPKASPAISPPLRSLLPFPRSARRPPPAPPPRPRTPTSTAPPPTGTRAWFTTAQPLSTPTRTRPPTSTTPSSKTARWPNWSQASAGEAIPSTPPRAPAPTSRASSRVSARRQPRSPSSPPASSPRADNAAGSVGRPGRRQPLRLRRRKPARPGSSPASARGPQNPALLADPACPAGLEARRSRNDHSASGARAAPRPPKPSSPPTAATSSSPPTAASPPATPTTPATSTATTSHRRAHPRLVRPRGNDGDGNDDAFDGQNHRRGEIRRIESGVEAKPPKTATAPSPPMAPR